MVQYFSIHMEQNLINDDLIRRLCASHDQALSQQQFVQSELLAPGKHTFYLHTFIVATVVPIMNGHPRDQTKVSVHCRWPLIRGNLTLRCVGRGIDNVAVQGRWPLTTGVAQGRYSRTCLGRPPLLPSESGRSRQVVSHNRSYKNHVLPLVRFVYIVTHPGSRPNWGRHGTSIITCWREEQVIYLQNNIGWQ